jgi:serine phosphatase RsbU (regulator of sigma subunit)/anti-sigma regulatory factor (Ser/Thr protein kinase)
LREVGNERVVRSLDPAAQRLDRVLDALVQAGRALNAPGPIGDALSQIAETVAQAFDGYCAIEIGRAADGIEDLRVESGTPREGIDASSLAERLSDGRRTFGTIACVAGCDAWDDAAHKAVHVLATELGVVLGGQASMRREHRVADRLQRALLPETLPEMTGAQFHAAYRPASDEAEVGGDWYDAFTLPDGRIAVSVGDVAGHGLEAAVIMGEVRQAIRTAAVAAESSASILDYVNRIILLRQSLGMVTAIFAIYDPVASTLAYASAGHPPPVLVLRNGVVRALPTGSLPLGCDDALASREWTFTVPAGAHVLFYTDGLIENERDLIGGERRLFDAVRGVVLGDQAMDDPASAITQRVFCGGSNRDDAAVLLLSRSAPAPYYLFSAVPVATVLSRGIVGETLDRIGATGERRFGVLVALGEAIANAVEHAYRDGEPGLIRLEIAQESPNLVLVVEDYGHWRPFLRRVDRGRGIELMHAFMDGVQIRSTRESTKIVLKAALRDAEVTDRSSTLRSAETSI